jgi:spore maturation protein CgeB
MNTLKNRGLKTFFQLGLAKGDESYIYNRSKCGINWSSANDVTARVFELGAIGTIPVYNRIPELKNFFVEDEHYIGFSNTNEAIEKITEISNNYDKYKHIGENIRKEVLENHTWDNRIQTMLEICGLA